jgi:transposase-like protein
MVPAMKYAAEFRDLAVRSLNDARPKYPTQQAAIAALSRTLGIPPEALQKWVRRAERDARRRSRSNPTEPSTQSRDESPATAASATAGGHVFLSYSRVDCEYVSRLVEWLEGHGVDAWYDHDIDYGARWEADIERQLDSAAAVLVVMSRAARRSEWVARELARAKERQLPVLPVLLEPDGIVAGAADLQFDNVMGGRMPGLNFCQRLPGFLVSERDLVNALAPQQRDVAQRIMSAVGGLRPGSKGPAVAALQVELLRVGLNPGPVNGVFGTQTVAAVREFQSRRCHLPTADAFVGPLTWAILANSSLGDLAPLASFETHGGTHQTE